MTTAPTATATVGCRTLHLMPAGALRLRTLLRLPARLPALGLLTRLLRMPRAVERVVARDLLPLPLLRVVLHARLVRLRMLHPLRLRARLVARDIARLRVVLRGARAGIAMRARLAGTIATRLRDVACMVALRSLLRARLRRFARTFARRIALHAGAALSRTRLESTAATNASAAASAVG